MFHRRPESPKDIGNSSDLAERFACSISFCSETSLTYKKISKAKVKIYACTYCAYNADYTCNKNRVHFVSSKYGIFTKRDSRRKTYSIFKHITFRDTCQAKTKIFANFNRVLSILPLDIRFIAAFDMKIIKSGGEFQTHHAGSRVRVASHTQCVHRSVLLSLA